MNECDCESLSGTVEDFNFKFKLLKNKDLCVPSFHHYPYSFDDKCEQEANKYYPVWDARYQTWTASIKLVSYHLKIESDSTNTLINLNQR